MTVLPSTAPGLGAGAYWLAGGIAALGLGGSLLTHELAHAIVARRAGLSVRRITLWLLLVGWFLSGSASAERAATIVAGRPAGLRVADVMSAPPAVASGWWTVQAFIDRPLGEPGQRYQQFPVVDIDGQLTGVVSMADLTRCSSADRRDIPVQQLARPLSEELVLTPDMPLEQVLQSAPMLSGALAAVVADGQVVGVLTSTDIARAVEIHALPSEKSQL